VWTLDFCRFPVELPGLRVLFWFMPHASLIAAWARLQSQGRIGNGMLLTAEIIRPLVFPFFCFCIFLSLGAICPSLPHARQQSFGSIVSSR
jgi:hypothetical protein